MRSEAQPFPGAAPPIPRPRPERRRLEARGSGLWIAVAAQAVLLLTAAVIVAGGWKDAFATALLATITGAAFLFTVTMLFRRGWFATAIFLLFVAQPAFVVYAGHVLGGDLPVWPGIFTNPMMGAPTRLLFVHVEFMILCMLVGLAALPPHERRQQARPVLNGAGVGVAWLVCGTFALLVLATALTTTRDQYVMDVQGGDRFVMVIGPLLIGLGAGLGLVFRNYPMKVLGAFCLGAAFLIALSGYRSVFVFAAMSSATALLASRRLSWPVIVLGAVGIFVGYQIMTFLAFVRAQGVSMGELVFGGAQLDWSKFSDKAGAAEQIAVFTVYYAQQADRYLGLTYLYGMFRSLPNSVYTLVAIPPRIQDILVEGGPIQFKQTGINLGAYFFAESIINFGVVLAGAVTAAVVAVLAWVEQRRFGSVFWQMLYPGLVMMMPVLALYGSANFVKQLLTMLVVLLILQVTGVSSRARPDGTAPGALRRLRAS